MRLNQYIALATGLSRRAADELIKQGRVEIDGRTANLGAPTFKDSKVHLDNKLLRPSSQRTLIMLNKPVGYVCSRERQGSKTIYDLLPREYKKLKPIGRLDKDSSGLLLLTDDGQLAYELSHPKFVKEKIYEVELDKDLSNTDKEKIESGVELDDGSSKLELSGNDRKWTVTMHEGRNRQIRRTLAALGYNVTKLHRTHFGEFSLGVLAKGKIEKI